MRRNRHHGDSKRFYDWLDKADADYKSAIILYKNGGDYDIIAFHCQQCIEKALKGFLLLAEGYAPDGHNLSYLCRRAIESDDTFTRWLDISAELNNYYIQTRYPSDFDEKTTEGECRRVLTLAAEMYDYIHDAVIVEMEEDMQEQLEAEKQAEHEDEPERDNRLPEPEQPQPAPSPPASGTPKKKKRSNTSRKKQKRQKKFKNNFPPPPPLSGGKG